MPHTETLVPEDLKELRRRLEDLRKSQRRRARLPDWLWAAAVELARHHGVFATARSLRLDYASLKRRLEGNASMSAAATPPAFVELIAPLAASGHECVVELAPAHGGRMRIEMKAGVAAQLPGMIRAFLGWGER